jgi:hypothetical protein
MQERPKVNNFINNMWFISKDSQKLSTSLKRDHKINNLINKT